MFALLHEKISEKVRLTTEEWAYCQSLFQQKALGKKAYLLQEGEQCRYQVFVTTGMLRSYTIDAKGFEHILQFAPEGWWMADLDSFFNGTPSVFNMEALEDAELLLLSLPSWNELLKTLPQLEHYFRILIQNNLIATQRRLLGSLSETAETKYRKFTATYPDCLQRVPQHMIAAYLGITKETLSRLRRQMAGKG